MSAHSSKPPKNPAREKKRVHSAADDAPQIRDNEGAVLSVIARIQPVTGYGVLKAIRQSSTSSYRTSKGTLYPLLNRMIEAGYLSASVAGETRPTTELALTERGHLALRTWIKRSGPEDIFGNNPLVDRMLALQDLPKDERIRWIALAKDTLLERKAKLASSREADNSPYSGIAQGFATAMIDSQLEWLDRLLIDIIKDDRSF